MAVREIVRRFVAPGMGESCWIVAREKAGTSTVSGAKPLGTPNKLSLGVVIDMLLTTASCVPASKVAESSSDEDASVALGFVSTNEML